MGAEEPRALRRGSDLSSGVMGVTIMLSTEFWYLWGRIARREADAAYEARSRFGATSDNAKDSAALNDELSAGVVAVCAAAFSVESLVLVLAEKVMPVETVVAWQTSNRTNFASRLRETLKSSLS